MQKKVAVIIPAKGNAKYLEKCIQSVLDNNYYLKEIIVVDDGLDKEIFSKIAEFGKKITILDSKGNGPSFARNLAAKTTDAEFLAFTDSDCIVARDWISKLLEGFEKFEDAVACGGRQDLPVDATDFERIVFNFLKKAGFISDYVRKFRKDKIFKVNHNPSCNVMYKKDIFLKEGGFLENLWPAEDVELDRRLKKKGYILVCNPQAIVYHYRPTNLKSFMAMMYRYGLTQGFLIKKFGIFRRLHILGLLGFLFLGLLIFLIFYNFIYFIFAIIAILLFLSLYFKFDFSLIRISLFAFLSWYVGFLKGLIKR